MLASRRACAGRSGCAIHLAWRWRVKGRHIWLAICPAHKALARGALSARPEPPARTLKASVPACGLHAGVVPAKIAVRSCPSGCLNRRPRWAGEPGGMGKGCCGDAAGHMGHMCSQGAHGGSNRPSHGACTAGVGTMTINTARMGPRG